MLKNTLLNHIKIDEKTFEINIETELSRSDYLELKNYIEIVGGQYQKKQKNFIFKINPKSFIDAFILTENMPIKNPTAFFPTPKELVLEMFRLSDLIDIPLEEEYQSRYSILEPSVGIGGISDLIKEQFPFVNLDVVEILDTNQEVLRQKGYDPICMDFLNYNNDYSKKYDYIMMNPPFQGKTHLKHVEHAFNMLSDKGTLCAILPTSFISHNDEKSKWLLETIAKLGNLYRNPSKSFIEVGTNVDTCIIVIDKSTLTWRTKEYMQSKNWWTYNACLTFQNTYSFATSLNELIPSLDNKKNLKELILLELVSLNAQGFYYPYEFIDDYVDEIFEDYCEIHSLGKYSEDDEIFRESEDDEIFIEYEEFKKLENLYEMREFNEFEEFEEIQIPLEPILQKSEKNDYKEIYSEAQIEAFNKGSLF